MGRETSKIKRCDQHTFAEDVVVDMRPFLGSYLVDSTWTDVRTDAGTRGI